MSLSVVGESNYSSTNCLPQTWWLKKEDVQYNFNGSNTDGSFTVDDLNSFFSPNKILPVAQENKYLGIFLTLSWNCMLCVLIRIASLR